MSLKEEILPTGGHAGGRVKPLPRVPFLSKQAKVPFVDKPKRYPEGSQPMFTDVIGDYSGNRPYPWDLGPRTKTNFDDKSIGEMLEEAILEEQVFNQETSSPNQVALRQKGDVATTSKPTLLRKGRGGLKVRSTRPPVVSGDTEYLPASTRSSTNRPTTTTTSTTTTTPEWYSSNNLGEGGAEDVFIGGSSTRRSPYKSINKRYY